ncbi:MAG: hypothetical protein ACRD3B_03780 [Candidatus Sulfotelmatobacter sp.]
MRRFAFRGMVSCVLLVVFPGSLLAADSNAAMLYTNGAAWINGAHVPRASSAIFFGDLLQTRSDSVANINEPGSSITILADSLVTFEGSSLDIDHGGVAVSTSRSVSTSAGDIKVTPAANSWTEFNVTDVDGKVRISAKKGDLNINDGKETVLLAQGQETTRDDSSNDDQDGKKRKKNRKQQNGAYPAAGGGLLNSPWAIGAGGAAVAGVTTWVLIQSSNPASPAKP